MVHGNGPTFSETFLAFPEEFQCISIGISLKFVLNGPIDNKSTLVQVMAWRQTGDKSLPEPMLTQFTDAFMHH